MSDKTAIAWTDATWNPVSGCSKVSPGCAHCYAETLSLRHGWTSAPWIPANAGENVALHPDRLDAPLHWRKPRRIFVCSMADLFHEAVPWYFVARVFGMMARTPRHTYQVLTKRPEQMRVLMNSPTFVNEVACYAPEVLDGTLFPWPLPNVWLGVSAENQRWADVRIPLLLQTPAARRFVSCEPLLGPIDLDYYMGELPEDEDVAPSAGLDWVIVGGESGPKYRPMALTWAHKIQRQCWAAGVAYFGKQDSGPRPGIPLPGELGNQEWPA